MTIQKNAWLKLKKENPNLNLARWSTLWIDEVENRQQQQQPQDTEDSGDAFGNFACQVMVELGFFESSEEITTALTHLNMAYDPLQEEALMEMLRLHVQALPTFTKFEGLLFQLHKDFDLGETEAKARLKALGFESFPREGNGEAKNRSRRMYWAVLVSIPKKAVEVAPTQESVEEDIPF